MTPEKRALTPEEKRIRATRIKNSKDSNGSNTSLLSKQNSSSRRHPPSSRSSSSSSYNDEQENVTVGHRRPQNRQNSKNNPDYRIRRSR